MKEIVIAFDIDGTLINNEGIASDTPHYLRPKLGVNLEAILLLQILSKKIKNSRIIVWSGGGKDYAESVCRMYGIENYVDAIYDKAKCEEHVDIAFDDIHSFEGGDKNLIVRMK